ncbi:hypothetical protein scyTo_0002644 [Scyliorhinus torazame]|uniref:Uncharacterized protein n=1 Tax=Scyliorhinus torazame TaxID=75743 RepID=A0A401PKD4_SCYTO|nr:hypothetical protein [Scyliorhinus torazame]
MKGFKLACTASNSARSTPACSPILRKRSRSPTPQNLEGENMVEKGSDHSSDKSPSTPEQGIQRSYSSQSGRSSKNSKKSQSWYNDILADAIKLLNVVIHLDIYLNKQDKFRHKQA